MNDRTQRNDDWNRAHSPLGASERDELRSGSARGDDDLSRRREQGGGRQPLTSRERDERWPIG